MSQSKKLQKGQSLNHLLNFKSSREDEHKIESPYDNWRRRQKSRRPLDPFAKQLFVQANYRFVVRDDGDYQMMTYDPDRLVDWHFVEQVLLTDSAAQSCPICLECPSAAKITKCGHVYCWPCILRYILSSGYDEKQCPMCFANVHIEHLKTVTIEQIPPVLEGSQISLSLMARPKGSVLTAPVSISANGSHLIMPNVHLCHRSEPESRFGRLVLTRDISDILSREKSELASLHQSAISCGEPESVIWIEKAQSLLKERDAAWQVQRKRLETIASSRFMPPMHSIVMPISSASSSPSASATPSSSTPSPSPVSISDSSMAEYMLQHKRYRQDPEENLERIVLPEDEDEKEKRKQLEREMMLRGSDDSDDNKSGHEFDADSDHADGEEGRGGGGEHKAEEEEHYLHDSEDEEEEVEWEDQEAMFGGRRSAGARIKAATRDITIRPHSSRNSASSASSSSSSSSSRSESNPPFGFSASAAPFIPSSKAASISSASSAPVSSSNSKAGKKEQDRKKQRERAAQEMQEDLSSEYFFFFQASDGQLVFLHPLNMKLLQSQFSNLQDIKTPLRITGPIVEVERHAQSAELRTQYKWLAHVPLTATILFVDVDVRSYVSEETYKVHQKQVEDRLFKQHMKQVEAVKKEAAKAKELCREKELAKRRQKSQEFMAQTGAVLVEEHGTGRMLLAPGTANRRAKKAFEEVSSELSEIPIDALPQHVINAQKSAPKFSDDDFPSLAEALAISAAEAASLEEAKKSGHLSVEQSVSNAISSLSVSIPSSSSSISSSSSSSSMKGHKKSSASEAVAWSKVATVPSKPVVIDFPTLGKGSASASPSPSAPSKPTWGAKINVNASPSSSPAAVPVNKNPEPVQPSAAAAPTGKGKKGRGIPLNVFGL